MIINTKWFAVLEGGYWKVKHAGRTIAAGKLGADGWMHNIEFLRPQDLKSNSVRIPTARTFQEVERQAALGKLGIKVYYFT